MIMSKNPYHLKMHCLHKFYWQSVHYEDNLHNCQERNKGIAIYIFFKEKYGEELTYTWKTCNILNYMSDLVWTKHSDKF